VDYRSNTQGIRAISVDWNDANLDGTFAAGERTGSIEYLIDNSNFTGYQQTILEVTKNAAGQATKRISYTFGTDEITQTVSTLNASTCVVTGTQTQTFGHDGRGSVQVLFDAAAAIAQVYTYSAYGELLAIHNGSAAVVGTIGQANLESLAATNKLYNGEGFDTRTGLYNFRARNYSASLGRFERLDPFAGNPTDPFSFNKYGFVHGNPVMGSDPTGMFFSAGGMMASMGIQSTMRGMHNNVLGMAASSGAAMYMANMVGENPFDAFWEEMQASARESLIDAIPVLGPLYGLVQSIGLIGEQIAGFFGWEIFEQIADIGNSLGGSGANSMASSRSGLGDARSLLVIMRASSQKLLQFVRQRNLDAMRGRIAAKAEPRVGVSAIGPYGTAGDASRHFLGGYAQNHHLNQDAAFRSLGISRDSGISIPLVGSTTTPGTPHYEFHWSMDTFWEPYREGSKTGTMVLKKPTVGQYARAVEVALRHAGYSRSEAKSIADLAKRSHGLPMSRRFVDIPERTIKGPHGY
jgi:RHS repeat-associated protein